MNKQRESVYALRRELLEGKIHITEDESSTPASTCRARRGAARRHGRALRRQGGRSRRVGPRRAAAASCREIFGLEPADFDGVDLEAHVASTRCSDALWEPCSRQVRGRRKRWSPTEILRRVERDIMLQIVDAQWKDHLYSLDHLKEGIGLRGYGQRDPLVEYKKESFALFQAMKDRIEEEIVRYLWRLTPVIDDDPTPARRRRCGRRRRAGRRR